MVSLAGERFVAIRRSIDELTRKECLMLDSLSQPLRIRQIADVHGISVNTVKHHLKNAYLKLGVDTRQRAVESYRARMKPPVASAAAVSAERASL
ncbi:LuxR family transcriptional regulator [Solimonas sp. K1W22B-7]|uniref:helix-turn-helix domain-containing protein n=1 Tax=Solimonas sp. K1W22B-7 TaxID=2303331 RepID=UPI000E32E854|nr:helix-turn-helix transcriptional regulator [Solimonas sp. K1W22B-7]AXQ30656.1 LuxR family transcriptional regulator [Solimonas sp. K1W22B-7]